MNIKLFTCLLLLLALLSLEQLTSARELPESPEEPSNFAKIITDENHHLTEDDIGSIFRDFGEEMKETMTDEMGKLIEDVEKSSKSQGGKDLDLQELQRFKGANSMLASDTQARIELAGQKNDGQFTQSSLGGVKRSFMAEVRDKLQSAGTFLGQHMSSLTQLAPKIRRKIKSVPSALRRLLQWPSFLKFKINFGKVYKTIREELYRNMIFIQKQVIVGIQNLKYLMGKSTGLYKVTQFSDRTQIEFMTENNNTMADDVSTLRRHPLTPSSRDRLVKLAKENKNIFGQDMSEFTGSKHKKMQARQQARRRRRKRDASELDESDDEEFEDENSLEDMLDADSDDEIENALEDESSYVDAYAADVIVDDEANLDKLDEINKLMDFALTPEDEDFEPIDLRETGCLWQPENQDNCGACYAYVVVAAATYYNCMLRKSQGIKPALVRYSTRFVSDCGRYYTSLGKKPAIKGCVGGKMTTSYKFIKRSGLYLFKQFEFDRRNIFRQDMCPYSRPETIDNWAAEPVPFFKENEMVLINTTDVNLHLHTVGPVFMNVRYWGNFQSLGGGIHWNLTEPGETLGVHSMLIVGQDQDANGRQYFIIWNSHGIPWGERGYGRIYRDALEKFKLYSVGLMPTEDVIDSEVETEVEEKEEDEDENENEEEGEEEQAKGNA